jgi:hypothetical protein
MKYIFFGAVCCVCVILVFSCTKQNFPSADSDIISTDFIPFTDRETAGILENESIDESSGLTSSYSFPGYLWTHNDSGDEARLFLLDETGNHVSEIKISGAVNRDWEDIASGVDPVTQKNYILIADIGDNFGKYDFVTLYQILEPDVLPEKDTSLAVSKKNDHKVS